jgi:hypothetical protein
MRSLAVLLPLMTASCGLAVASVDVQLVGMAPSTSTLLLGIDMGRVATSRSAGFVAAQLLADPDIASLMASGGFDIEQGMQQILFAGLGRQTAGDSRGVVIARGTFDPARLRAVARAKGAATRRYRGATILVQGTGDAALGLAFPETGIAVIGDLATVRSMLAPNAPSFSIDPRLRAQVNRISNARDDVWFATLLSGRFLGHQLASVIPQIQSSQALRAIERSSGGIQFAGHTVTINLDLIAGSAIAAQSLSGLLNVAGTLIGMSPNASGTSLVRTALHSVQVAADGATIHAKAELAETQVEEALALARN